MKENVGKIDKGLRLIGGLAVTSLFFLLNSPLNLLGLLGIVFIITSLMSWCPIYAILGMKTCPSRK
ncbi:MAG: hypothetical protein BMS9Abin36_1967 [Gammaproteobacteria bacterium]|nr:MAG: hypothetical protein BMS9Abin36_1967 [Gammaproteobacteria bacterium]